MIKLNLGCGSKILPGYINVDVKQRGASQPDIIEDINDLSDHFEPESVDEILSVHVIEHFYPWEVKELLSHWSDLLRPNGKLIIECPDLEKACWYMLDALSNNKEPQAQFTMWPMYGDPGHKDPLMMHKWGWTPRTLGKLLWEIGFVDIEEKPAQFKMKEVRDMRMECRMPGLTKSTGDL